MARLTYVNGRDAACWRERFLRLQLCKNTKIKRSNGSTKAEPLQVAVLYEGAAFTLED
jgi:hypothetical protein